MLPDHIVHVQNVGVTSNVAQAEAPSVSQEQNTKM